MVASFGERLKKEREKRGMTLEDVSGTTKISVRNLRALEQEKFDQMPGGIFNRGFVRAYAKHLGLDDDQVVADYLEAAGESLPTLDPADTPPPPHTPGKAAPVPVATTIPPDAPSAHVPWAALIGLVILGAVVLGFWSYHSHRKTTERPMAVEPGSATHLAEVPSPTPESTASPAPSVDPGTVPPVTAASSQIAATGTTAGGFDVALRAHDEVWLSSAVDGKPPSESIMEDGQSIVVHASERAILKVGNAGALDVAFNGQKISVRAAEGEVRTLTFTASGLQTPSPAAPRPN